MRCITKVLLLLPALALAAAALASDPPDSSVNPKTSLIETTDSHLKLGNYEVRHTRYSQPIETANLSNHPADDLGPRMAIPAMGHTWIAWWRDGVADEVLLRRRDHASGSWSNELVVGAGRQPSIVADAANAWVAFEADAPGVGNTDIQVRSISDEPDPIGGALVTLATTSFSGDCDTEVHLEAGSLWVTWVDSASEVGWSSYDADNDAWSEAAYEDYGADSVADARQRIADNLTGD